MGTTAQKLQAILNSKSALKTAIEKYKSNIGDKFSDYAPVVSEMADIVSDFSSIATGVFTETITIPYLGNATLRSYLFYNVKADEVRIESGYTTTSARQFSYLNYGGTSSDDLCYVYLPNTITSFSNNNPWTASVAVIPVLENGWQASFTIAGITHNAITQTVLENMIDALADLSGETGQTLTLANSSQYNLISAEKLAAATSKNWTVTY